jgi:tRNA threonylcarbamoyladenosine biosynthesis protein TsaE
VCLVEWPEKAQGTLPPADVDIHLALPPDPQRAGREARLTAASESGRRCLSKAAL